MESGLTVLVIRGTIIGALLFPLQVGAELAVLYDSGHTLPLAPLLEVLSADKRRAPRPAPGRPNLGAADLERLLPIDSLGLTPGPVKRRPLNRRFARPFFLIGSDRFSRQWLARHRDRLLEIGAVGMLVQAETVHDLRVIAGLAEGLSILPASAADIAEALGLVHYPVLVSGQGMEQ
jgi:integrating conjugative element protein (TIGR03765 family)